MTRLLAGHLLRSDLAHADEVLIPTAAFELRGATVSMTMHDADGVSFLLDCLLDPAAAPTTVSLHLRPRDYRPEDLQTAEFPPSNLVLGIDQRHGVAAAALLAFDRDHRSHQWLPQGDAWRDGVATLVMDPAGPADSLFPREAYVSVPQLREIVTQWAWGTELPPAGVRWRVATEREVRWSWF
jgi:hypothetical protein